MKYLTVFLVIVWLQLGLVDQAMAQRSRTNASRLNKQAPALVNSELALQGGYERFWDKQSQGFFGFVDGNFISYLSPSLGLGVFASVAGGGGNYHDGSYREPSTTWQAGLKTKLRGKTSFVALDVGYGQISLHGELGNGFQHLVYSDFLLARFEYQAFSRRVDKKLWLPAADLFVEGRMALKKDTPLWSSNYAINYDLSPEILKVGGELVIVDLRPWGLTIPWGLSGAVNMYDFQNLKVFYEIGTFVNFSYANNQVAKINFSYQNGITGITNINRFSLGASLDASFFFKINQENTTQPNNTRRRSR